MEEALLCYHEAEDALYRFMERAIDWPDSGRTWVDGPGYLDEMHKVAMKRDAAYAAFVQSVHEEIEKWKTKTKV